MYIHFILFFKARFYKELKIGNKSLGLQGTYLPYCVYGVGHRK